MYIKEIFLQNFKSFGRKARIPFFDDFTTVSGPNGSGKSNIIDAILFALGLSTSRAMRAEKLTDLIYKSGNGDSPNFAEVTVRFDNKDRELPVECDEVVVTRKVKQTESGYYSYYYFNDRACSLSDIQNQLAKARITPECFNVILQGDVTRIIEMTPMERRRIIDEIAGVAEFDEKTDQAYDELNIVRERIERVDIILAEVETRLKQLEGERAHALKYQSLRDEKKRYEGMILLSKLKSAEMELESAISEISKKQIRSSALKDELGRKKAVVEQLESKLGELNGEITRKGEGEQIQIKKEMEEVLGELARCKSAIEYAKNEIADIDEQQKRVLFDVDRAQQRISEIEASTGEEQIRSKSLLSEIQERSRELDITNQKMAQVDEEFAGTRNQLLELKTKLENIKSEKNEFLRNKDRLLDSLRRKNYELEENEQFIASAKKQIHDGELEIKKLEDEINNYNLKNGEIEKELADFEAAGSNVKRELNEVDQKLRSLQHAYAKAEAMIKAADEMSRYSSAVELILQAKRQKELPGLFGTIAELGKVDAKYAVALEISAGARMQCIVADNDEDAARAIEFLKRRDLGRVTFLPLSKMQRRPLFRDLPESEGIIDYAINLVSFNHRFDSAFWYVFGDTVVVANLDIARKLIGKFRMVTLEGELIERAGAITGGSSKSRFKFAISEEEKIKHIAEEIAIYESKRLEIIRRSDSVQLSIDSIAKEKQAVIIELEKKKILQSELDEKKKQLAATAEAKAMDKSNFEMEKKSYGSEIVEADKKIQIADSQAGSVFTEIAKLEKMMQQSEIPELAKEADRLENEIKRLEARLREIETGISSLNLEKNFTQSRIAELHERIKENEQKKQLLEEKITTNENLIKEIEARLEEKRRRELEIESELAELKNEREQLFKDMVAKRSDLDSVQREFERVESWIKTLETAREELFKKVGQLKIEIEQCGVKSDEEVPPVEAVNAKITALDREMLALEPVNMRAITEYEEVGGRQQELTGKRDTLSKEREAIIERIEQYRLLKKQTFMVTFDGINLNFQDIFKELCDGRGDLSLENPESPFEGGLAIIAHPRDRPAQRLEALSGGEKSITALAFIFAIQRYRPAPFYAFDEIDMFLDGVNAERIAKTIKKASGKAQFIVVSLRKPMIESANRTIGVTMQENNISTITGVRLNQVAEPV